MSLLIGIDASRAVKDNRTGTENYSWEIIRALLKIDRVNQYWLYAPRRPSEEFGKYPNASWQVIPDGRLWSQLKLVKALKNQPPDVLFVPSHVVPLTSHVPTVVTIHGLEYKYSPRSYRKRDRAYLNFSTSISVGKAKKVIVPSQQTKNDVIKFYHCPTAKIRVIAEAADAETFSDTADYGTRPISEPYIFSLGRLETRKNQQLLVEAFALLRKEKSDIKLVLAGGTGYGFEKIQSQINTLPLAIRESVILLGYISNAEALRYLKHAAVFAFPSLSEGFGLPILEAMAIGTPVVASNAASLPEVAGDAAVLLPPDNPLSWAAAFSRIIHQPRYAAELRRKGLEQNAQFSWAKAAKQTLKVIEDAAC